jgi:hypothetical protein
VLPRAVLDAVVKKKISSPRRESKPRTPFVQPAAQRYTDYLYTVKEFTKPLAWLKFRSGAVDVNEPATDGLGVLASRLSE